MNAGILNLFDKVTVTEDFAKSLELAELSRCDLYLDENKADLELICPQFLDRTELLQYRDAILQIYHLNALHIGLKYPGLTPHLEYFQDLLSFFLQENAACRICLGSASVAYCDKCLSICGI